MRSLGGRLDLTRLVVTLFWAALAAVQIQRLSATCDSNASSCSVSDPAPGCGCNQYFNSTTERCSACTRCCETGQLELSPCTRDKDATCSPCVAGKQFFNAATSSCRNCTICGPWQQTVVECTADTDTTCQRRCQEHQFYVEEDDSCQMNCRRCTHGCVTSGPPRCRCVPANCYEETDILCKHNHCTATEETTLEVTNTVDDESNELPTWGIGLISIGVVIGIVAFSAGSMILSFCTRRATQGDEENGRRRENESKPDLMGRYCNINGQPSPFLCPNHCNHHHHHSLDSQRNNMCSPSSSRTNSIRSGSLRSGSIRSSPKATRMVPSPRTENATPI